VISAPTSLASVPAARYGLDDDRQLPVDGLTKWFRNSAAVAKKLSGGYFDAVPPKDLRRAIRAVHPGADHDGGEGRAAIGGRFVPRATYVPC
jgi:hypothetical protein